MRPALHIRKAVMYCSADVTGHMRPVQLRSQGVLHTMLVRVAGQEEKWQRWRKKGSKEAITALYEAFSKSKTLFSTPLQSTLKNARFSDGCKGGRAVRVPSCMVIKWASVSISALSLSIIPCIMQISAIKETKVSLRSLMVPARIFTSTVQMWVNSWTMVRTGTSSCKEVFPQLWSWETTACQLLDALFGCCEYCRT